MMPNKGFIIAALAVLLQGSGSAQTVDTYSVQFGVSSAGITKFLQDTYGETRIESCRINGALKIKLDGKEQSDVNIYVEIAQANADPPKAVTKARLTADFASQPDGSIRAAGVYQEEGDGHFDATTSKALACLMSQPSFLKDMLGEEMHVIPYPMGCLSYGSKWKKEGPSQRWMPQFDCISFSQTELPNTVNLEFEGRMWKLRYYGKGDDGAYRFVLREFPLAFATDVSLSANTEKLFSLGPIQFNNSSAILEATELVEHILGELPRRLRQFVLDANPKGAISWRVVKSKNKRHLVLYDGKEPPSLEEMGAAVANDRDIWLAADEVFLSDGLSRIVPSLEFLNLTFVLGKTMVRDRPNGSLALEFSNPLPTRHRNPVSELALTSNSKTPDPNAKELLRSKGLGISLSRDPEDTILTLGGEILVLLRGAPYLKLHGVDWPYRLRNRTGESGFVAEAFPPEARPLIIDSSKVSFFGPVKEGLIPNQDRIKICAEAIYALSGIYLSEKFLPYLDNVFEPVSRHGSEVRSLRFANTGSQRYLLTNPQRNGIVFFGDLMYKEGNQ